ncbi:CehA/McbA family metallohydrolase [soil metagenome]
MTIGATVRSLPIAVCAIVACSAPDVSPRTAPQPTPTRPIPIDAEVADAWAPDAIVPDTSTTLVDASSPVDAIPTAPEVWLKGSTHVHARPSGDSATPIAEVTQWYERRGYDFIVLTDHNQVSELDKTAPPTTGPVVSAPAAKLIVLAGIELTHNPSNCIPPGDDSGKCRIHVNLLGVTGRVTGKLAWANRRTNERLAKYDAALEQQKALGGIAQINHPNWFWGINGELLAELARHGFRLVEIANSAFTTWNEGDGIHPAMEAVWDAALKQGVTLWGVASDDAHDYSDRGKGKYPAGGGWVVVKAARDPAAILASLDAGRFYSSNGVVLARADVDAGALVVEVAKGQKGSYVIDFIENGKRVTVVGRTASRKLPATGYLRAVVTRGDGKRAWVQPARR